MSNLFYIHCDNEILNGAEFFSDFASAKEMAIIIGGELFQFNEALSDFIKIFDGSDENFDPDYWLYKYLLMELNPNGGYTVEDLI